MVVVLTWNLSVFSDVQRKTGAHHKIANTKTTYVCEMLKQPQIENEEVLCFIYGQIYHCCVIL